MMERKVFNDLLIFKQKISDAQNRITELNEQLENTKPNIFTLRDKILYVVDSIYVRRISRFVCEIKVTNKWTGEVRTYEYNTRKFIIHKMSVKLRDTLNYNG